METKLPTYTPYRRVEEIVAKSGKTEERKRNYSYLGEVEKKKDNEEDAKDINPYFQENFKVTEKESPITKFKQENEEASPEKQLNFSEKITPVNAEPS